MVEDEFQLKYTSANYETYLEMKNWCIKNIGAEAWSSDNLSDDCRWHVRLRSENWTFQFHNKQDSTLFKLIWFQS